MIDLRGDLATLSPFVRAKLRPARPPAAVPWTTSVEDPDVGSLRLTGALREQSGPAGSDLYLVIHGLGGGTDSFYCLRTVEAVAASGASSLCLALRGADRSGEDFYNVALRADIEAAVASPELAHFERIFLVGHSMGGHSAMSYACGELDPRVRAVVAINTPLDLGTAQRYIDTLRAWPYRKHVLDGLKQIYAAVARRGRVAPSALADVLAVRTIREWDRLTIAPRYGYRSPEHYYEELSIQARLGELAVPVLLVVAERDPIIPPETIAPFVGRARGSDALEVRWVPRAGHLSFPRDLDLGFGPALGLEAQVRQWLLRRT